MKISPLLLLGLERRFGEKNEINSEYTMTDKNAKGYTRAFNNFDHVTTESANT